MSFITIETVVKLITFLSTVLALVYAFYYWRFQTWKKKNVPYLTPSFPGGNLGIIRQKVPLGEDITNVVRKAKAKGKNIFE